MWIDFKTRYLVLYKLGIECFWWWNWMAGPQFDWSENISIFLYSPDLSILLWRTKKKKCVIFTRVQGDQLNIAVSFWYLVKSDLSSERYCTRVHWTSHFFQGTRKNTAVFNWSPCILQIFAQYFVWFLRNLTDRISWVFHDLFIYSKIWRKKKYEKIE